MGNRRWLQEDGARAKQIDSVHRSHRRDKLIEAITASIKLVRDVSVCSYHSVPIDGTRFCKRATNECFGNHRELSINFRINYGAHPHTDWRILREHA